MGKSEIVWTSLSNQVTSALDEAANRAQMSKSAFVRFCIPEALNKSERDEIEAFPDEYGEGKVDLWTRVNPDMLELLHDKAGHLDKREQVRYCIIYILKKMELLP